MAGKRKTNPAGSTNNLRGDVLRVLGVLKVATVEQIQQISAPHMSYRHTDKDKPSQRKQARTASHLGALSDLRKHGLVENGGKTSGGDTLRNLTPMGLKAASYELGRPVGEMGGPARGAGRSGASHPIAVNDTLLALLRPKPDLTELDSEPTDVLAAAQDAVDAPAGLGTIASYATEVPLPATGTWSNLGKGGARADIVLTTLGVIDVGAC
ncbi:hypothetical protein AB0D14_40985 [Streptomyces sp. NPDC048484]|uniref:hypothetical protein n=1 Tax=Streptomyces sp. NPDC048484 TaxID=3155146 RepID=UPI003432EBD1